MGDTGLRSCSALSCTTFPGSRNGLIEALRANSQFLGNSSPKISISSLVNSMPFQLIDEAESPLTNPVRYSYDPYEEKPKLVTLCTPGPSRAPLPNYPPTPAGRRAAIRPPHRSPTYHHFLQQQMIRIERIHLNHPSPQQEELDLTHTTFSPDSCH